jgi:hypothetical protein
MFFVAELHQVLEGKRERDHTHVHDVGLVPVVPVARRAHDEECMDGGSVDRGVSVVGVMREPEEGGE